jgi:hypothetical protein
MASGHVNRIKRPNTWLHRPMLQNREESSCQPGAVHTWHIATFHSAAEFRRYRGHIGHRASRTNQARIMSTRPSAGFAVSPPHPDPPRASFARRSPAKSGARENAKGRSIRPCHLEHGVGANFKIIALAAGAHDRACQRGLVHAVLDQGLVDVHGDDFAEGEPGLHLPAVGAL